jgi:uncharacterized membrane protein
MAPSTASRGGRPLSTTERFGIFGVVGLAAEVCFTALSDRLTGKGDARLRGYSYLWMPPIWGAGGLLCERLGVELRGRRLGLLSRGLAYAAVCLGVEYLTGALLVQLLGRTPWDYTQAKWNVSGLIRLDYAPYWALAGLAGETLCDGLARLRVAPRPLPQRTL